MSLYTDEKQLENHFGTFGKIENIQIVYDKQVRKIFFRKFFKYYNRRSIFKDWSLSRVRFYIFQ